MYIINRGWRERRASEADARLVRCMDFERAHERLPPDQQLALVAIYRDKLPQDLAASIAGCSVRKFAYLLPAARANLADILDRLNLL
jgi:DNA-directed RNA polymerase specialized sigma24 family protein